MESQTNANGRWIDTAATRMEDITNIIDNIRSYPDFIDIELKISPNNQREKFFDRGLINLII